MNNPYGYNETHNFSNAKGIQDGEIIEIMLLDYTLAGTKRFQEQESKRAEECKVVGIDFEPIDPTFKELGICWKYAVITRIKFDDNEKEKVFKSEAGKLIEPNYFCYGQINEYPPKLLFKNNWNYQRYGGSSEVNPKTLAPVITAILPNAFTEMDWKNKVRADAIPKGQEGNFGKLIKDESIRKSKWNQIIDYFDNISEDEGFKVLNKALGMRFLNCIFNADKNEFDYLPFSKGTILRCKAIKPNKFLEVISLEYLKSKKGFEIYSALNAVEPAINPKGDMVKTANMIIKLREENKVVRAKMKEAQND